MLSEGGQKKTRIAKRSVVGSSGKLRLEERNFVRSPRGRVVKSWGLEMVVVIVRSEWRVGKMESVRGKEFV